jgi:hypothetical protein
MVYNRCVGSRRRASMFETVTLDTVDGRAFTKTGEIEVWENRASAEFFAASRSSGGYEVAIYDTKSGNLLSIWKDGEVVLQGNRYV